MKFTTLRTLSILCLSMLLTTPTWAGSGGDANEALKKKYTSIVSGGDFVTKPKNKCDGISCTQGFKDCAADETAVNEAKPEDCCAKWVCKKNILSGPPPSPFTPNCLDAPAVMRKCKDNVEPTVSQVVDEYQCSKTVQTCPEDNALSAPLQQSNQDKADDRKPASTGQVLQ